MTRPVSQSIVASLGSRELLFALAVVTIWTFSRVILGHAPPQADPRTIELAVTIDLTVTITALWYLLVVRARGWPALTAAPVFLASIATAGLVLPDGRKAVLETFHWLAIPVELLLLSIVAFRARRASRAFREADEPDLFQRIRTASRTIAPGRAADAIAYEVTLLWHAVARRIPTLEAGPGERILTSHRRAAYGTVVAALLIAVVVEAVAVHFLLAIWTPTGAWVATALSVYGALWLVGDYRAIRARPSVVGPDRLHLRLGLRWEVEVPVDAIESVESGLDDDADVRMVLPAAKGVTLTLSRPVEAVGPYGMRRRVETVSIGLDEPGALTGLDTT
ncbi:MAG: hypothetical protein R3326_04475 [Gemmatimonadota bacterium]|nr:hypothetical protein [Gemmatimonadota bacterium]